MDVWFRKPREPLPRGTHAIDLHCFIFSGRLFEHVDRATPSALLTLLIMDDPISPARNPVRWSYEPTVDGQTANVVTVSIK